MAHQSQLDRARWNLWGRMNSVASFGWVDSPSCRFFDSACITAVAGGDVAAVAHAFGATNRRTGYAEALAVPAVALLPVAGGVVAVEPNGYERTRLPVYSALSLSSRTATAYWSQL
jgi:hypothetical protein